MNIDFVDYLYEMKFALRDKINNAGTVDCPVKTAEIEANKKEYDRLSMIIINYFETEKSN